MRGNPGPTQHSQSIRAGAWSGRLAQLATTRFRDWWERLMSYAATMTLIFFPIGQMIGLLIGGWL
jgi:Mn2+/Fe2+ NRAMP family transporter